MEQTDNKLSAEEIVRLGAVDPEFYARYFFPDAVSQASPPFHKEIWKAIDNPSSRLVGIKVFRGGAKTTLLRLFASRRIAYGISRTIIFVSAAQQHSLASLDWLRGEIENNEAWTRMFGLSKGDKWTENDLEIRHSPEGVTIRVIALGMTGQLRGFNFRNKRPDLIIADDPCNDENTGTPEQREKTERLFLGALIPSLAPKSEAPHAKVVLLQTPLHSEDLIEIAMRERSWDALEFGCFEQSGDSRWPSRWSTEELESLKQGYRDRNKLSVWYREYECTITPDETSAFREEWLRYYNIPPSPMTVYIAIDPAPPHKDLDLDSKRFRRLDYQAIAVIGVCRGRYYLLDYDQAKGEDPDEFVAKLFTLIGKYRPIALGVENVAYQRTLQWLIEKEMKTRRMFIPVNGLKDRRAKGDRIRQAIDNVAPKGLLYIHRSHEEFLQQYKDYPNVTHDDLIDAVSMGIFGAEAYDNSPILDYLAEEDALPALPAIWRTAP